jgi:hypothetical protein
VRLIALCLLLLASVRGADPKHQDGVILEAKDPGCNWDCIPFLDTQFFCLKTSDTVLIGIRRDWPWGYRGALTWGLEGLAISLRYDEASIWIVQANGKEFHLSREYPADPFRTDVCFSEVRRRWLQSFGEVKRPQGVPVEAVLVPQGAGTLLRRVGPHFWAACRFDAETNLDRCVVWNEKGFKSRDLEYVDSSDHAPVAQAGLAIDPLMTESPFEIHLRNGVVLKDWAKSRINNQPSADSVRPTAEPKGADNRP